MNLNEIDNSIHDAMKDRYEKAVIGELMEQAGNDEVVIIKIHSITEDVLFMIGAPPCIVAEIKCFRRTRLTTPSGCVISGREAKAMLQYARAIENMRNL